MLVKMETQAAGGGDKLYLKKVSSSDWSSNKITFGFKPKKFLITDLYFQSNIPISAIYDEDVSTSAVDLNYGSTNYSSYAITSF